MGIFLGMSFINRSSIVKNKLVIGLGLAFSLLSSNIVMADTSAFTLIDRLCADSTNSAVQNPPDFTVDPGEENDSIKLNNLGIPKYGARYTLTCDLATTGETGVLSFDVNKYYKADQFFGDVKVQENGKTVDRNYGSLTTTPLQYQSAKLIIHGIVNDDSYWFSGDHIVIHNTGTTALNVTGCQFQSEDKG